MMLSIMTNIYIILLIIFLIVFTLLAIALIRTIVFKNSKIKVLEKNSLSSDKINEYQNNMQYLFTNNLLKAIKNLFPNVCEKGQIVQLNDGFIVSYIKGKNNQNILINIPISKLEPNKIKMSNQNVLGENTYNSKSQLYCILDALENIILSDNNLGVNIYIDVYPKDKTNDEAIKYLKKQKLEFELVLGEGGEILDTISTGFRSFYAFLGVGINEKIVIRFKTKKISKGFERLEDFIEELNNQSLFEMKIDKEAVPIITNLSKDMLYGNRFILNNISWLPRLGKRIVEEELLECNKAWKTRYVIGDIFNDDEYYYVDIKFYLSSTDSEESIINLFKKMIIKYSLEYSIISKDEKSRDINGNHHIYNIVKNTVENVFQELYTTPYIINEEVHDRKSKEIGKCVIRFAPLYYSRDALIGQTKGTEWVSLSSIDKCISFYEELFINFGRK